MSRSGRVSRKDGNTRPPLINVAPRSNSKKVFKNNKLSNLFLFDSLQRQYINEREVNWNDDNGQFMNELLHSGNCNPTTDLFFWISSANLTKLDQENHSYPSMGESLTLYLRDGSPLQFIVIDSNTSNPISHTSKKTSYIILRPVL